MTSVAQILDSSIWAIGIHVTLQCGEAQSRLTTQTVFINIYCKAINTGSYFILWISSKEHILHENWLSWVIFCISTIKAICIDCYFCFSANLNCHWTLIILQYIGKCINSALIRFVKEYHHLCSCCLISSLLKLNQVQSHVYKTYPPMCRQDKDVLGMELISN